MNAAAELSTLVKGIEKWIHVHGRDRLAEHLPLIADFPIFVEKYLVWRGRQYDLSISPTTLEICRIFHESPGHSLSKEELTKALFGETRAFSEQLRRAIDHNVVKRLSRARLLLRQILGEEGEGKKWFHYDQDAGRWMFLKVNIF